MLAANGTLSEPSVPTFEGSFDGEILHTSAYKSPTVFAGKRVLIIGAGNSGCDIAVDAVHHAASVDISVRRGYYFVPKYLFGKPSDTLNQGRPLPPRIKQAIDSRVLKMFTGDPVRFGFPKPDYKIYESHPIVNSLILHHLGHGDLAVRPDIDRLDGDGVVFADGTRTPYDVIVLATGYHLHYPFLSPELLRWAGHGSAPDLYLNIFTQEDPNLFVLGMIEASGIGWQGRYEQAELVASYLRRADDDAGRRARARAADRRAATGPVGRISLPRAGTYVLLRQQGRLPPAVRAEIDRLGQTARSHRMTVLLAQVATLVTDIDDVKIDFSSGRLDRPEDRDRDDPLRHRAGHQDRRTSRPCCGGRSRSRSASWRSSCCCRR